MKILFICTHNRCRSILAEAISNHLASGKIEACSAGSQPVGEVHPLTFKYLREWGISTDGLRSKSWDELQDFQPDFVITVCDKAAQEACPVWLEKGTKVHWGLPDPSKLGGSEAEIESAFRAVMSTLEKRVGQVAALDLENLNGDQLKQALTTIGVTR